MWTSFSLCLTTHKYHPLQVSILQPKYVYCYPQSSDLNNYLGNNTPADVNDQPPAYEEVILTECPPPPPPSESATVPPGAPTENATPAQDAPTENANDHSWSWYDHANESFVALGANQNVINGTLESILGRVSRLETLLEKVDSVLGVTMLVRNALHHCLYIAPIS